jgi:hypothetical protein
LTLVRCKEANSSCSCASVGCVAKPCAATVTARGARECESRRRRRLSRRGLVETRPGRRREGEGEGREGCGRALVGVCHLCRASGALPGRPAEAHIRGFVPLPGAARPDDASDPNVSSFLRKTSAQPKIFFVNVGLK